jgi:hypothetical protein
MVKNFRRGFNGDYGVKLTPSNLKFLYEVDWLAFGVRWPLKGSLNKTVVNKVYRLIIKKKYPNIQENGKGQEAKIGLQKPDSCLFKFR